MPYYHVHIYKQFRTKTQEINFKKCNLLHSRSPCSDKEMVEKADALHEKLSSQRTDAHVTNDVILFIRANQFI
jgi:hypothetical protein